MNEIIEGGFLHCEVFKVLRTMRADPTKELHCLVKVFAKDGNFVVKDVKVT